MQVSAVSSAQASSTGATSAPSSVSTETFLKLLTEQLRHQDPMEPMSGEQMLSQMSQLTMVSEVVKLGTAMQSMAKLQDVTGMASLVGRIVEWRDTQAGTSGSGLVTQVQRTSDGWQACIGNQTVPLDAISSIA